MVVNRQCMLVVHYGVIKHPINIIDYKWIQDLVVIIVNQCLNYVRVFYLFLFFLSFFQFALYIYLFVTFVLSSRTHNSTQLTQSFASLPIISLYCTSLSLTLPYYLRMRIHITMINKIKSLQSTCTRIRRRI